MPPPELSDPRNLGFSHQEVREAEELGIDLGLLHENLQLTPSERAEQHDTVVAEMMKIQAELSDAR